MSAAVRVVIADDQPLVRSGLVATLSGTGGIEVVGEAEDGRDAVRAARLLQPDVVLMDLSMPRMDGIEATRRIREDPRLSATRVLVLSAYGDDERVFGALRAGAGGFVLKNSAPERVAEAVDEVLRGGSYLSPAVAGSVVREVLERPAAPAIGAPEMVRLTDRELEVFRHLVGGLRNDEIADALNVGESTVKSHVQHLYRKLGVRDRVQVVVYAYEHGLVHPGVGPVSPQGTSPALDRRTGAVPPRPDGRTAAGH
ncbi:response regulator transcription factor [Nocardiopsis sp. RSe5-2]|uniref:Response regulator transcription factor n=1 Tax=Nocardiopsis endophytica TaxID=3018445 RepID=A0ABT4U7R7_9ACTN|nr:response regulator transcription factor [Nocardiopsis endophytica]MDA2813000.1 response regulator transcription factor [Nocardiopsis endophytica]